MDLKSDSSAVAVSLLVCYLVGLLQTLADVVSAAHGALFTNICVYSVVFSVAALLVIIPTVRFPEVDTVFVEAISKLSNNSSNLNDYMDGIDGLPLTFNTTLLHQQMYWIFIVKQ